MALFKILKGDSSRISTDITPFHDGYAYFTPDDGGFYIDATYNSTEMRVRVNPEVPLPILTTATLTTSGWSSNSQTVTVAGVVADSNAQFVDVVPADKASVTAWSEAGVWCASQGANSLTFTCDSVPAANINLNIRLQGVSA